MERDPGRLPSVIYVIGTYPSTTTTFIDREIELLRRWGLPLEVVSLRRPAAHLSAAQRALQDDVTYVLPVRLRELVRSHVRMLVTRPIAYVVTLVYLLTRRHPSLRARVRTLLHFGEAVHAARLVAERSPVDHVHAHFVDRATVVALVMGRLLGVPYSATAHANDIYVDPVLLDEKLAGASFVATCTRANASHLAAVAPGPAASRVVCIHHGLDLRAFDVGEPVDPVEPEVPLLLCVAQLRPKKGLADLIDACARLVGRGYDVRCRIIGEGPLRPELETRVRERGLEDVVEFAGALPHDEVLDHYRRASVFVLPCVVAPNGDRDGIPNALLEAMASKVPVVSTAHSGIPEAVEAGRSGLLVPPGDVAALTDALARLLDDPDLRRRLGAGGRDAVLASFDIEVNGRRLLQRFVA